VQNQLEHFAGETRDRSFTLEARYALANWNKLPLNPAISAEYRFGLSNVLSDSGELALLILHDFSNLIEWAMNIFVDREFGGRESTSAGFAHSVEVPVLLPEEKLEVGLEMQYRSGGEPIGSIKSPRGFAIAQLSLGVRPRRRVSIFRRSSDGAITHPQSKCSRSFRSPLAVPRLGRPRRPRPHAATRSLEKRSVSNLIEVMADERWERLVEQQGVAYAQTVAGAMNLKLDADNPADREKLRRQFSTLSPEEKCESVEAASQRLIPTGEQSGLQTRIATTESVSLCTRMKS